MKEKKKLQMIDIIQSILFGRQLRQQQKENVKMANDLFDQPEKYTI